MKKRGNFAYFISNLRRKHRLSLRTEHEDEEVWYMHISPLSALAGLLALVLVLFIIILTTVAYTSILDLIPGYPGNKSREMLIANTMRLDSMERELSWMQIYTDNVALIMEGKTPVVRSVEGAASDSLKGAAGAAVGRNAADSILRAQMEGSGMYRLGTGSPGGGTKGALTLTTPVKGVVGSHFNPREGRFGVGIATASNQQVMAVREGTVTLAVWTPDEGHILQIQHTDNIVSIYKHCATTLPAVGARVKNGEVIGATGDGVSGEAGKSLFEFELWIGGTPVDPETYIVF